MTEVAVVRPDRPSAERAAFRIAVGLLVRLPLIGGMRVSSAESVLGVAQA